MWGAAGHLLLGVHGWDEPSAFPEPTPPTGAGEGEVGDGPRRVPGADSFINLHKYADERRRWEPSACRC